jgi:hypothetical protein
MTAAGIGRRKEKKTIVEVCRPLDACRLAKLGVFARPGFLSSLTWSNGFGEHP